tara:strand:+ start:10280 stop:10456 length:177 start_codon:yes stop_codon:yes gene_type:complete
MGKWPRMIKLRPKATAIHTTLAGNTWRFLKPNDEVIPYFDVQESAGTLQLFFPNDTES